MKDINLLLCFSYILFPLPRIVKESSFCLHELGFSSVGAMSRSGGGMLFSIGAIGVGTYFLYNAITSMDKPLPPTAERSSSNAASAVTTYNKEEQMVSTVFGKGPANLTELRKQTTERRKKVSRTLSNSFQFASR